MDLRKKKENYVFWFEEAAEYPQVPKTQTSTIPPLSSPPFLSLSSLIRLFRGKKVPEQA